MIDVITYEDDNDGNDGNDRLEDAVIINDIDIFIALCAIITFIRCDHDQ